MLISDLPGLMGFVLDFYNPYYRHANFHWMTTALSKSSVKNDRGCEFGGVISLALFVCAFDENPK
jgi:hypothetical protein